MKARRRGSLAVVLLALALAAAACATSNTDGPSADRSDDDTPGGADTVGAPGDTSSGNTAPGDAAVLVETDCFRGEQRCGIALLPQVPGSQDLVEVAFRVVVEDGPGVPVVLLEDGDGLLQLDPADFPERPLIALGSRRHPPGGPTITCPEWGRVPADGDDDEVRSATATCARRLGDAGLDLDGGSRENQASDAISVLDALDLEEFDVIASGLHADLVATIDDSPLTVRRAVYVRPSFSGEEPIATRFADVMSALDAVWARCDRVDECVSSGTVASFLAAIEDLRERPIPHAVTPDRMIDADQLIAVVLNELDTAAGAAFLPRLHRIVIDRDAAALSAYVDSSFTSPIIDGFTILCGRVGADAGAEVELPEVLRRRATRARSFFAAACPAWGVDRVEEPVAALPGLRITSLSRSDRPGRSDPSGPTVREPTVGAPSPACVIAAAAAWIDDERVDDRSCRTPLSMGGRGEVFEMVTGRYDYDDDLSVIARVPNTWADYGNGTWYREADPIDSTNLDIYVWDSDDPQATREEMVASWDLVDPSYGTRPIGGRKWQFATGSTEFGDDTFVLAIAVARVDGVTLGFVLGADSAELDDLVETVLVPSLASVEIRG
jgi:hypothetical protein